ncbi:MAG TPA: SDR family NAD(P)-dependent oxidoreductase [Thermoleophilia bacterium]|nr:SDR family NAD(P)-dependent oxidoreductase [Thermoleophilia bacterium]
MRLDLDGAVALVTGGAGGIGRASAAALLEEGATVVLGDLNEATLREAVDELSRGGRHVHGVAADISRPADCERLVGAAVELAGRLDALINAAGVWVEGPSETMTEEQWDHVVDVNLKGTFFCCRYAIPELKQTQGCIVNLSSDAGVVGTPETAVYTASKGGVSLLTKSLALELAPDLVRVNAICPADVMTPMLEGQARDFGGGDFDAYFGRLLASYPQRDQARFIRPEEIAALVSYLASPLAAPITGALISIDFGTSAGYGYG